MYISADEKKRSWEEYSLIIPAVSVGNVGQLTADLIISTLCMSRAGYIYDDAILPLVGNDPFAHADATTCKLVTSCEVHESVDSKLVVVQQRAPFVKGKQKAFRKRLVEWIRENCFYQVIVLTSSYAHERLDVQLTGSQFRFLTSPSMDERIGQMIRRDFLWQELEKRSTFPAPSALTMENGDSTSGTIYLPGSGIAKQLYEDCFDDIPILVLTLFCSEGDNAQDAVALATHLNDLLDIVNLKPKPGSESGNTAKGPTSWKIPVSWKLPFGNRADQTLYH